MSAADDGRAGTQMRIPVSRQKRAAAMSTARIHITNVRKALAEGGMASRAIVASLARAGNGAI